MRVTVDIGGSSHKVQEFAPIGACVVNIQRILGEIILISSLPGKALRTLFNIARLAEI